MLFGTKNKVGNAKSLILYIIVLEIKWHVKVKYLICILDEGESMALNVIDKVHSHLKFPHRQNRLLYLDFYVMQWYNLFLIMPAQTGFQICPKFLNFTTITVLAFNEVFYPVNNNEV